MVALPKQMDPTLEALDREMEQRGNAETPRSYLGFSGLGHECERKHWYDFRACSTSTFEASTLRKFADGHHGEDMMAERLRLVPGIELWTHDENGRQFGITDHAGHARGHVDGVILGLLQAPKTPHIWEHKQCDESKLRKLERLIEDHGEKQALRHWDPIYYSQAVLYMHGMELTRHYLTVASPGGRRIVSCRTEEDPDTAERLLDKAGRVIASDRPGIRANNDPGWWMCKWCNHHAICHGTETALPHCGTCIHASPELDGDRRWSCDLHKKDLKRGQWLSGCRSHAYIPELLENFSEPRGKDGNTLRYVNTLNDNQFANGPEGYASTEIHAVKDKRALGDEAIDALRAAFKGALVG